MALARIVHCTNNIQKWKIVICENYGIALKLLNLILCLVTLLILCMLLLNRLNCYFCVIPSWCFWPRTNWDQMVCRQWYHLVCYQCQMPPCAQKLVCETGKGELADWLLFRVSNRRLKGRRKFKNKRFLTYPSVVYSPWFLAHNFRIFNVLYPVCEWKNLGNGDSKYIGSAYTNSYVLRKLVRTQPLWNWFTFLGYSPICFIENLTSAFIKLRVATQFLVGHGPVEIRKLQNKMVCNAEIASGVCLCWLCWSMFTKRYFMMHNT